MLRTKTIQPVRHDLRRRAIRGLCAALLAGAGILAVSAQTTAPPSANTSQQVHTAAHKRRRKARKPVRKEAAKAVAPAQPVVPPPPPPPDWPALKAASPAIIHWDGKQLSIAANNSSLQQVIAAVSAQIHVPVTGLQGDQRLFGNYGPGTPRQVLTELLDGSGYDLLIVGGSVTGIPQRVELSRQGNSSIQAADRPSYNPPSTQPMNPAQQQLSQPGQPPQSPTGPPMPGMTPQQLLQQRMQMMQQRQAGQPPQ